MIKTIRINIPFSETQSMYEVLNKKLLEIGLTIEDIQTSFKSRNDNSSHFGNWCYVGALDTPELRKTDMLLDLPQNFLEVSDIIGLKVGDRVEYKVSGILGQSFYTGRIFTIEIDNDFGKIEISKGKSKIKGYRFYTGDILEINKI